jgi:hypothetical protein
VCAANALSFFAFSFADFTSDRPLFGWEGKEVHDAITFPTLKMGLKSELALIHICMQKWLLRRRIY